jgi:hypothetical protein
MQSTHIAHERTYGALDVIERVRANQHKLTARVCRRTPEDLPQDMASGMHVGPRYVAPAG